MGIKTIVDSALNTNWTLTDDFNVKLENSSIQFWSNSSEHGTIINKCLMSIDIPTLTSPETDLVMGGERRIGVKQFEAFRFTAKFRDLEGGELRRYFEAIWVAQQYMYFDKIKTNITITVPHLTPDNKERIIFKTEDALITSVSSIQFDNASTQIAEFDVTFIANKFSDDVLDEFGHHKFIENFKDAVRDRN